MGVFVSGQQFHQWNWKFGEVFVPTTSIYLTYLGYYNPPNGMGDVHPVGIFDAAGNLLSSTTVTTSCCFTPPLPLQPGSDHHAARRLHLCD